MERRPKTLKELWESRGLSATDVAGRAAISTATLYRMNNKERVYGKNIYRVCSVLNITREQYDELEADRAAKS